MISLSDKAYAAGLLDGEGSVMVARIHGRYKGKTYPATYRVRITITNTDRAVIEWLQSKFSGGITTQQPSAEGCQWGWRWFLSKKSTIEQFLKMVSKYVIIKKAHVTLALKFMKLTFKDYDTKCVYFEAMRKLNHKGERIKVDDAATTA